MTTHDAGDLQVALDRLASEDRLRCVVDGQTTNDGKPASTCPELGIRHHQAMCAGCAARRLVTRTEATAP